MITYLKELNNPCAGVNVNVRTTKARTPLHFAAESGDLETIQLLLQRRADPTAITKNNEAAVDLCKTEELKAVLVAAVEQYGQTKKQAAGEKSGPPKEGKKQRNLRTAGVYTTSHAHDNDDTNEEATIDKEAPLEGEIAAIGPMVGEQEQGPSGEELETQLQQPSPGGEPPEAGAPTQQPAGVKRKEVEEEEEEQGILLPVAAPVIGPRPPVAMGPRPQVATGPVAKKPKVVISYDEEEGDE